MTAVPDSIWLALRQGLPIPLPQLMGPRPLTAEAFEEAVRETLESTGLDVVAVVCEPGEASTLLATASSDALPSKRAWQASKEDFRAKGYTWLGTLLGVTLVSEGATVRQQMGDYIAASLRASLTRYVRAPTLDEIKDRYERRYGPEGVEVLGVEPGTPGEAVARLRGPEDVLRALGLLPPIVIEINLSEPA